ncbi:MAG: succinyl-diaminopimelate desuccinylase, partial [Proteobacteria bacterium]|nr:succinyl-diaminopimelate desuccinylase [Pseudomonadota bacterium]
MSDQPDPDALDPVDLAQRLIRCPSVTPEEGGALDLLERVLGGLGFTCHRLAFREPGTAEVENLYARLGSAGPNFCYAGHTDVVPVGDAEAWSVDPFAAEIVNGALYGRGAVDMKGSIAAFLAALAGFLERRGGAFGGSISLLITGDEEAEAVNGTRKVLAWLEQRGEKLDACLVGEPTSNETLADMVKIGRRGSLNARLTVFGTQGHTAYPQLAD